MKYSIILLGVITISCGQYNKEYKCTVEGNGCEKTDSRSQDGQDNRNGKDGKDGQRGAKGNPGTPGSSCSVEQLSDGVRVYCTDGTEGRVFDGEPGSSCSVTQVVNGAIIECQDGTNAVILNGQDGVDGTSSPPTAYTFTDIKDPCGDQVAYDEVLFHAANGQWIAHYAGGGNLQFLTIIGPGNYITTDGSSCHFTIDNLGNITNEHN